MQSTGNDMKRSIPEYEQLAKRLLQDRAITELGSDTVLCYRVAEPREKDASDAILELLEALEEAKDDMLDVVEVCRCGDCKYKDDGIDEDGYPFLKCLHGRSYGGTRINDYCSWGQRREESSSP